MDNLQTLTEKFAIPEQVTFRSDGNGLIYVEVNNALASASIAMQGAHLLSWAPVGTDPVIWVSPDASFAPGKSVRGGIPVCWPWFGAHSDNPDFPAHGFARTSPWELTDTGTSSSGATQLRFRLVGDEKSAACWPYACTLHLHMSIGHTLEMDLITHNTGDSAFSIGQALHTYFQVADVSRVSIDGLETCEYLDKVQDFQQFHQSGPITIDQEVDRIYLDTTDDCVIRDPLLQRRLRIHKQGSHTTVVWNPWQATANKMGDLGEEGYLKMVCVESANAASDVVTIEPGKEYTLKVLYSVEPP